jgi:hypothetical protein
MDGKLPNVGTVQPVQEPAVDMLASQILQAPCLAKYLEFLLHLVDVLRGVALAAATGMRYALLNPILDELVKEGRIKTIVGKHGDIVSLISR